MQNLSTSWLCGLIVAHVLVATTVEATGTVGLGGEREEGELPADAALGKILDVRGVILDLIGLEASTTGGAVAVSGSQEELDADLRDLGAKRVGTEIHVSLSGDVLFDFDRTEIKPEAEETLSRVAVAIRRLGTRTVTIEGHTDAKGNDDYNYQLSVRRARAVKNWLESMGGGLKEVKFVTQGKGEAEPVAANTNPDGSDNPAGRALNRRVEIRIADR